MANATPDVEFETTLRPAARSIANEFGGAPEPPAAWLAVKDAQILRTRLQLRARAWCPAALFLLIGIALGVLPIIPLFVKCAVGGAAGVVFGWVLSSYRLQVRRTDALYRDMPKPTIKIKE